MIKEKKIRRAFLVIVLQYMELKLCSTFGLCRNKIEIRSVPTCGSCQLTAGSEQ